MLTRRHMIGRFCAIGGGASLVSLVRPVCGHASALPHGMVHRGRFHNSASHETGHHTASSLSAPALIGRAVPPRPVIMLDPGHGGKDSGAIGITGIYEKHVVEATAHILRHLLLESRQYKVVLTRSGDHFIPLGGRVELAHRHKADLFVSIHADALLDRQVRGASVYTRAHGASDHQTALLAKRENSADRFASPHFRNYSPDVAAILGSLESEETRRCSADMARKVVASFRHRIRLLHNPSRHAAFVVLKSADIPSVLVEMGFMSNHLDEAALREAGHRQNVAKALKMAIDQYFSTNRRAMG